VKNGLTNLRQMVILDYKIKSKVGKKNVTILPKKLSKA
jgi:hypothetical protein